MKIFLQFIFKMLSGIFVANYFETTCLAAELYQVGLPPRCMAMGGTCVTQVRGSQAIFFNPAALARIEGLDFTLLQFSAAVSKDAESYVNALNNNSGSTITAADIQNLYGKTVTADVSARTGVAIPYFGIGAYSSNYLSESFNNPAYPTFNVNYISDYGYVVAGAIPLAAKTSLGVAVRSAKRWGGVKDIDVTTLLNSSNQDMINENFPDRGSGIGLDLSLLSTIDAPMSPTFSFVWFDVGQTRYRKYTGSQDPPSQSDNLIFGASVQHDLLLSTWTYAIEYKHILTNGEDFSKKLHVGAEASFGLLDLRGGLNQGYLTYGVGLDLFFFQLDATVFASELGAYAGQSRNDRYQVGLTFNFDFDQSFKLTNRDGKRRKLKQRR